MEPYLKLCEAGRWREFTQATAPKREVDDGLRDGRFALCRWSEDLGGRGQVVVEVREDNASCVAEMAPSISVSWRDRTFRVRSFPPSHPDAPSDAPGSLNEPAEGVLHALLRQGFTSPDVRLGADGLAVLPPASVTWCAVTRAMTGGLALVELAENRARRAAFADERARATAAALAFVQSTPPSDRYATERATDALNVSRRSPHDPDARAIIFRHELDELRRWNPDGFVRLRELIAT